MVDLNLLENGHQLSECSARHIHWKCMYTDAPGQHNHLIKLESKCENKWKQKKEMTQHLLHLQLLFPINKTIQRTHKQQREKKNETKRKSVGPSSMFAHNETKWIKVIEEHSSTTV